MIPQIFLAAGRRSAQWSFRRPLLGRWSSWLSRISALAEHGPDAVLPRKSPPHSRPTRLPFLPAALPLGAIDPSPNFGAFASGVELMVFTALFTISVLLVLNWIIKTMKGSNER